jgi:hypothetical protein
MAVGAYLGRFRSWGQRAHVRIAGDRRLHATVVHWQQPVRLSTRGQEWFAKSSALELDPKVELRVKHYGPRAGQVIQWRSHILGLDAVVAADETPTGDGLLELVDRWAVQGHRVLCPSASTNAVVSLTITRWPLQRDHPRRQGRLLPPLSGTRLAARWRVNAKDCLHKRSMHRSWAALARLAV